MTLRRRIASALLLAGAGLVLCAPGAGAHAVLRSSDPADGAQLQAAPPAITLTFTEEPEPSLSTVRVLDSSGASFETARPAPDGPRTLRVAVRELPQGVYTVAWRVVSRVDGHATGGAFAFGVGVSPVGAAPPAVAGPETPPVSPAEVAGRWLLYAGLLGIVGAALVAVFAFPLPPPAMGRFFTAAWTLSLGGLVLLALAQRSAAGAGLGDMLSTSIGRALLWRAAAILAAGAAIILRPAGRAARVALLVAAAASAGGLLAHVGAGHAAANDPAWRSVASQFVHVLAAGVWIGGLAALLLGVRGIPSDEKARAVRRFSAVAGIALAAVAVSGVVRAIGEVESWSALASSTYGRLVIAKAALIVGLATLGAVNRYRNVPRARTELSGLRRISRAEIALAALALGSAAGLASTSPPAGAAASSPPPDRIVLTGTDFAQTVRVRLEIASGFAGPNSFVVRASVPGSGDPVEANRAALRFRFSDASVGETELELERTAPGVYVGQGSNLSLDGSWTVTVILQRATDSFEIPLELATRCRAEAVPVSGGPTLYNVKVPTGSAQLYVDPGRAGQNEIHVTFFTPAGGELTVVELPAMTGTSAGGAERFEVRRFSPGHFVADATLEAGVWRLDFAAALPGGDSARGCFEETIR